MAQDPLGRALVDVGVVCRCCLNSRASDYKGEPLQAVPCPLCAPVALPDSGWRLPPERWSGGDRVDIQLRDGSILRDCIPQADGDLWWSGAGIGERFIDPVRTTIERWRITPMEDRDAG